MNVNKDQWQKVLSIVLSAVLAVAAVLGWVVSPTLNGQTEARLREKISIDARDDAMLYNGADLVVYSDDHSTEKARIDGATGSLSTSGFYKRVPATAISVTQNVTLTLAAGYQPLQSAGNVSTGAAATCTQGNQAVLINESNTTITLTDTGNLVLGGNAALGQYDTLELLCDSQSKWVQLSKTDN